MNIFNVLSMGKSNLHEPSMSAMFAFLLNPNQDHGLGRKVIDNFLSQANKDLYGKYINNYKVKFDIDLEVPYRHNNKRNDIDIQIKIMDTSYNELHRIIIENKIKTGASNPKQLKAYYQAVLNDKGNDDPFELDKENLSVIFLTPKQKNKGLEEEFDNLEINSENKSWLYWNSNDNNENTIVKLIQNILKQEQEAVISPVNEYMRHTLKAFAHYIIETINISNGKNRVGVDIGQIKRREKIKIDQEEYIITLRDSGQIQLFDGNEDRVVAKPLLKKFAENERIETNGDKETTRTLGAKIFKHIDSVQD